MPNNKNNKQSQRSSKKKNQNAPRPKKRSIARPPPFAMPFGVPMSHCANKYATAIATPWDPEAQGVCIPTFPSRASQKVACWLRCTATVGTAGVGFIAVTPALANGVAVAYGSTAAFAGTAVSDTAAGVTAYAMDNLPYTVANISGSSSTSAAVSGRLVSFGLSTQYTGTVMNQGGLTYKLVEPNHGNLNGATVASLGAFQETEISRVTSNKNWSVGAGIDAQEVQYPEFDASATPSLMLYPFCQDISVSATNPSVGGLIACHIFTGTAGNTYQCELVVHIEYVGAIASTRATPTHSDARGFEMVNTAANRIPQMAVNNPKASVKTLMTKALSEIAGELAPYARAGVRMVGASALTAAGTLLTGNPGIGAGLGRLSLMA